ncbi:PhoH-like protein [Gemmata obscuriglobus]|uniref:PhoH-like protein n=1 Tax=Gemmata obscuriglobus TaxID=114 RepID=A0A2Z3H7S0_9BACT|nr:PhoH family protein [Gemmata obscuriglobus]AWM39025.1 PhoH family protein [Gemmata obscuriglobus]QEG27943.1 PhoH-like protein [Gemmata obscuriglobus]VTS05412.1 family protein : Phosphate starvation-inducible protein PhoH, predicted ATPase OS=Singulisphaera acidiphila (strain ATCC BAA-1392 / DSM 18658 / VKM B-2454 / MOB10) GN=Sinac_6811 PE=4 SV=1: PhoH [Gemmata obscuriglobus UQM 2246]
MPDLLPTTRTVVIEDRDEAVLLFGTRDQYLRALRDAFGVKATYRNPELRIEGSSEGAEQFERALQQVRQVVRKRGRLEERDVTGVIEVIKGATARGASPLAATEVGRNLRTRTDGQGRYVQALQSNDAVICVGPAGSGKTYLAVAWAVSLLNTKKVKKIVLVRPAVEAGERLGFLPGDLVAKISPYLRPLYDALADMMEPDTVKKYMESEVIEILPLAYMRGRTLSHACIILDEGQNATCEQMKMFLTRMGTNSRVIVTGDMTQIDLPRTVRSGLADAVQRLKDVEGLAVVHLEQADIVRNPLVTRIVKAYEDDASKARKPGT